MISKNINIRDIKIIILYGFYTAMSF